MTNVRPICDSLAAAPAVDTGRVVLTPAEYRVLVPLIAAGGGMVTQRMLMRLGGFPTTTALYDHTSDLRTKVQPLSVEIRSVFQEGYQLIDKYRRGGPKVWLFMEGTTP